MRLVNHYLGTLIIPAVLLGLPGCKADKTTPCGDQTCREGYTCDTIHDECVVPAQLEECVGETDGAECAINGVHGYVCDQEVCLQSECGDGILDVHTGEECDDGNHVDDDECPNNCTLNCGDGTVNPGEECDRNDLDDQTCDTLGWDRGQLTCELNCTFDESLCTADCGNGSVHSTEACDDGNTALDDGCSDMCEVETHWQCSGDPSVCVPIPYDYLAGGGGHICAHRADDTWWCWGLNANGQLGNGLVANAFGPVSLNVLSGIVDIAAGGWHTCALMDDATVWCWGLNNAGQLGNGTTSDANTPNPTPVQVTGLTGVVSISAGAAHTCAIKTDGTTWCWGANGDGQLGDNATHQICDMSPFPPDDCSPSAVQVSGLLEAVTVSAGGSHTCAIRSNDTVWCWGWNNQGQVGDGTTVTPRATPVLVTALPTAVAIDGGLGHTCAVRSDGTVWCWGWNNRGQIGVGSAAQNVPTPTQVSLTDVAAFTTGYDHTCAVQTSGTTTCWGANTYGQLGDNGVADANSPVPVTGFTDGVLISSIGEYTCATRSDGTAWCWGWNDFGQLGDGSAAVDSNVPVPVVLP